MPSFQSDNRNSDQQRATTTNHRHAFCTRNRNLPKVRVLSARRQFILTCGGLGVSAAVSFEQQSPIVLVVVDVVVAVVVVLAAAVLFVVAFFSSFCVSLLSRLPVWGYTVPCPSEGVCLCRRGAPNENYRDDNEDSRQRTTGDELYLFAGPRSTRADPQFFVLAFFGVWLSRVFVRCMLPQHGARSDGLLVTDRSSSVGYFMNLFAFVVVYVCQINVLSMTPFQFEGYNAQTRASKRQPRSSSQPGNRAQCRGLFTKMRTQEPRKVPRGVSVPVHTQDSICTDKRARKTACSR